MNKPKRIASFEVDHDLLTEGIYVSRVDGDITTYDLRTRIPNAGDYMDNLTMHSVEHMIATLIRSGPLGGDVIYFGPMGCQTGFYLLMRGADNHEVLSELLRVLREVILYEGEMFGGTAAECGNYRNLSLAAAKAECKRYLAHLESREQDFKYKTKEYRG